MTQRDPHELLVAAKQRLGGARGLLQRPRTCNVDECVTLLREAQGYLEWLRDSLSTAAPVHAGLRGALKDLASDARQTGVLLEQAARFGRRWLDRLQSSLDYTEAGRYAALQPRGRVSYLG